MAAHAASRVLPTEARTSPPDFSIRQPVSSGRSLDGVQPAWSRTVSIKGTARAPPL